MTTWPWKSSAGSSWFWEGHAQADARDKAAENLR
jgi:hypothetical protein